MGAGGGGGSGGAAGGAGSGGAPVVSLPQAIGGAMLANPVAYPDVPLRVRVDGTADAVDVEMEGATIDAA